MNNFYVYEWYNYDTGEIFYVGKGCKKRKDTLYHRNKEFLNYYNSHNCKNRIIRYFEEEEKALRFEHLRIIQLKKYGLCKCNLDNGGTGGMNFIWTPEMREYKSKYNPMKNKEIKEKVAKSKSKIVIYKGEETTTREISNKLGIHIGTAQNWAKRGYDTNGEPCYYKDETTPKKKTNTNSKAVIIDNIYFNSLREAAKYLGVKDTSPLCKALKANRNYKGHSCKYANQQPSEMNSI